MQVTLKQLLIILLVVILAGAGVWFGVTRQPTPTPPNGSLTNSVSTEPKPIVLPVGFVVEKGDGYFDMVDQNAARLRVIIDADTRITEGATTTTVDAITVGRLVVLDPRGDANGGLHAHSVNLLPAPPSLKKI